MNDKATVVRTIYVYLMLLIGMILMIWGLVGTINFVVNVSVFKTYPVKPFEMPYVSDCPTTSQSSTNAEVTANCQTLNDSNKEANEQFRLEKKAEDLTNSLAYLFIGLLIFGFHWKLSKNNN